MWGDESRSERGQATIEYALVVTAFLAMLLALGSIWEAVRSGTLQRIAEEAASHNFGGGVTIGLLQDLESY